MELTLEMPRTTQPPIDGHKTRMTIDCILRLSCGPGFEVKLTSEVLTVGLVMRFHLKVAC